MLRDSPHELLLRALRTGAATATGLEQQLSKSRRWLWTYLPELVAAGRIIKLGGRRDARYGARREIEGIGSAWPLRRVGRTGLIEDLGTLYALMADQYYLEFRTGEMKKLLITSDAQHGLPYFLQDQRPGGYLGRSVPLRYPELDLPQRVTDWTDDHYLRYLTTHGSDTVGDLILGGAAFDEFAAALRRTRPIDLSQRQVLYPRAASGVMDAGLPGSSAQGEHPKFTALLQDGGTVRHVLVKFSPPRGEAAGQRWADLLIAEHHAHGILRAADLPAAHSRILTIEDRIYLEVDRFDRADEHGRIGVTSLLAIDTRFYGRLDNWVAAAERLHAQRHIDAATLEQVRLTYTFGGLIANTDRHFGNLAFFDDYDGRFRLAPLYDMLPMLFAPEHSQILNRQFSPPSPVSGTIGAWRQARVFAERYWQRVVADERISDDFRKISATCLAGLEGLPRTGAYA